MSEIRTPGFWDLHLHGVAGVDFMNCLFDDMVFASEKLGKMGIAYYAPTLLTADTRSLEKACLRWGMFFEKLRSRKNLLSKGSAIPIGLHLEGPFLNPMMAGAHPKNALAKPSIDLAKKLIQTAFGHVKIVTLAPEVPRALEMTKWLVKEKIRVQMGHSLANSAQAMAGARAGATGITHLYNAMRTHHREPGLLSPLTRGLVSAELITDGIHLAPDSVLTAMRAFGPNLYAVSDGCCAIHAKPGAKLTLGDLKLKRKGDIAVVASSGTLAGGATRLCDHPAKLLKAWPKGAYSSKKLLEHFYLAPAALFDLKPSSLKNHFDSQTLKFLG